MFSNLRVFFEKSTNIFSKIVVWVWQTENRDKWVKWPVCPVWKNNCKLLRFFLSLSFDLIRESASTAIDSILGNYTKAYNFSVFRLIKPYHVASPQNIMFTACFGEGEIGPQWNSYWPVNNRMGTLRMRANREVAKFILLNCFIKPLRRSIYLVFGFKDHSNNQ
jgi:hypothetical protein